MEFLSAPETWIGRVFFERGLAALYLIAFIAARNQFPALLGERGLLPAPEFLRSRSFAQGPSLFHWRYSDRFFSVVAWTGIAMSAAILVGALAAAPVGVPMIAWLVLSFLYLSIVNVGQRFYGFGWESMLVEAGFFAAVLSPQGMTPSLVPILMVRWMLFRVEVGAGLIKIRAGGPWKDLTALIYHHETQPMPNPLSRFSHRLPRPVLRGGVVFSHFVQIAVPFGLFFPQPVAGTAAALIILHQLLLIVFGNYAWLNWLTVVLAFAALPNSWLTFTGVQVPPDLAPRPMIWEMVQLGVLAAVIWLSIKPIRNLCSRRQLMNYSFNRWRLVNAYGAFGSITKVRHEIVIEGTADSDAGAESEWREYEFKGKPGDPKRLPPQVAPYHLRLDWLMWFLPLSVRVTSGGIFVPGYEPWFQRLIQKLLEGDRATIALLKHNPFPGDPPRYLRARFYRYWFAPFGTGKVWERELVDEYLPPVDLPGLSTRA
ncbi:MAG: lipase maturation factor family protein [Verrucomicrobiales bacterium]